MLAKKTKSFEKHFYKKKTVLKTGLPKTWNPGILQYRQKKSWKNLEFPKKKTLN